MPSIINSDDGAISGSSGLETTGGNDGVTVFQQNGVERLRIGTAGQLGVNGTNYGSAGQVLTSGGASAAPTWTAAGGGFAAGTAMLFVQTSAPTGWTKSTTHDNKALRVVSGTASSGGSVAFTTAFASQAVSGSVSTTLSSGGSVGATTLATAQIPSHTHTAGATNNFSVFAKGTAVRNATVGNIATGAAGGGGSHDHGFTNPAYTSSFTGTAINLAVQYVDVIVATKD